MNPSDFAPFALLIAISFFMAGVAFERWRTSPLRRIRQKYKAERDSALRN